ncbi:uncharacterized protein LOC129305663 [Prosopis cineraria]|uniref:uncharacterized protein LOC129305663 n=1 Tax=Prosopis cineraria TaxID=364024 RepID=UPI00240F17B8|nr:uncharacterized protein LOC129305663 [Prosopis cineraria]
MRITPLSNGYFIVSFTKQEDLNYAYQEGPWMIDDHYLLVQKWRPNFNPWKADTQRRIAAWIRIMDLPVELYNVESLRRIGNMVGRTLKIDLSTSILDMGAFRRICVELDLSQPLLPSFMHFGEDIKIGYEGLHLVCFHCGKYGHHKDVCPEKIVPSKLGNTDTVEKSREADQKVYTSEERDEFRAISEEVPVSNAVPVKEKIREMENTVAGDRYGPEMLIKRQLRWRYGSADLKGLYDGDARLKDMERGGGEKKGVQFATGERKRGDHGGQNQKAAGNRIFSKENILKNHSEWVPVGAKRKGSTIGKVKGKEHIPPADRTRSHVMKIRETRTGGSRAQRLAKAMGFHNFEVVDARGFSGGLWVLWNDASWKKSSHQTGASINKEFCSWVEELKLSDLGCKGPYFTWKRAGSENRIDRVLSNESFNNYFPEAVVTHLPFFKSDHRPLLLRLTSQGCARKIKDRPFRFNAAWVLHDDFESLVNKIWLPDEDWCLNVSNFTNAVNQWSHDVFGHIGRKKRHLLNRIEGLNISVNSCYNEASLERLQKNLWQELEEVILQENLLSAQKAKCNFIPCSISFPCIDNGSLHELVSNFCDEEIKNALFSMGPLKSPGPDGLNALFFQSQWKFIGNSVINMVQCIFNNPSLVHKINGMLLILIPKKERPESIHDFRPISLCNVIYKVVTKVIANRVKSLLPTIIAPNQCGFISGRTSSDNIIISQEVIHSMSNMKGKKGFMAIKIDLEKAYDRVNWDFLISCLEEINLPTKLVEVIQQCVRSSKMQLLWEGSKIEEFKPTRGLRQGDPLSPYLFVLCIEKLAHLIQEEIVKGNWRPIRLKKDGPLFSHLFFADDLVIFAEATLDQVQVIRQCLDRFCAMSGQKVSYSKTRVFFSRNVNHNRAQQFSDLLEFNRTADLGKYLGVPLHHNRVTNNTYQFVVDKMKQRLSSWKATSISFVGRTTLTKSVLNTIPLYCMQTAHLPVSTCEEIDKCSQGFLWGSTRERRKIHLVTWDEVCKPKINGGLGLRHAHLQNKAFMMKAGWGLIHNKEALWARVIRSKYKCGRELIPQVNRTLPGSQFWRGLRNNWEKVEAKLELITNQANEKVVRWKHEKHGIFTVRSAYDSLIDSYDCPDQIWAKIWKLRVPQRCRSFLWLMSHDRILTNKSRFDRHLDIQPWCSCCPEEFEDTLHVMRQCPEAKEVWMKLLRPSQRRAFFTTDLREWCKMNLKIQVTVNNFKWCDLFAVLCWAIWKRRNERVFEGRRSTTVSVIAQATVILNCMNVANCRLQNTSIAGIRPNNQVDMTILATDELFVYVDGAFVAATNSKGCGGLVKDTKGNIIEAFMLRLEKGDNLTVEL